MSVQPAEGLIKRAGAIVLATALVLAVPTLLALPGFLGALFRGALAPGLEGVESIALMLLSLIIIALKVSAGTGLVRLQKGAWLPAVTVTGFDLLLHAYWQVRVALSEVIPAARGIGLAMLVFVVAADIATLAILYASSVRRAFPDGAHKSQSQHETRMRYCRNIRDGWQNLGRGEGFTVVNLAPVSFIVAPVYWAAAGVFYLVVVLPFRPWGGR